MNNKTITTGYDVQGNVIPRVVPIVGKLSQLTIPVDSTSENYYFGLVQQEVEKYLPRYLLSDYEYYNIPSLQDWVAYSQQNPMCKCCFGTPEKQKNQ